MKHRNRVWVHLSADGTKVIKIFKKYPLTGVGAAINLNIAQWPRKDAVESIRQQVFERANNECQRCGKPVTWSTMHMDERIARGDGGEISLANCWALCYDCHEGRSDSEHGERRLRFGEYNG